MKRISFFVMGLPVAKGSMRVFGAKNPFAKSVVTSTAKGLKQWEKSVRDAAWVEMVNWKLKVCETGVKVGLKFQFHQGDTPLNPPSMGEHIIKPDLDKLTRAVLDGMTGVVYKDDCLVYSLKAEKYWTAGMDGVFVEVEFE